MFHLSYITDRQNLAGRPLVDSIREAIVAGVDLIQIREKDLGTRKLLGLVEPAVAAAQGTPTRIVVNDRLDVALAASAAGVHLGGQSLPAEAARRVIQKFRQEPGQKLGQTPGRPPRTLGFLIGVSCHSLADALDAESAGADYAFLGPIFETPSKLRYGPPLGLARLREVTTEVKIPVLALGGLTVLRVKPCLEAGAAGIAGISLFQTAESLPELVWELRAQFIA